MKKCPVCRVNNSDSARLCSQCGAILDAQSGDRRRNSVDNYSGSRLVRRAVKSEEINLSVADPGEKYGQSKTRTGEQGAENRQTLPGRASSVMDFELDRRMVSREQEGHASALFEDHFEQEAIRHGESLPIRLDSRKPEEDLQKDRNLPQDRKESQTGIWGRVTGFFHH